MQYNKPALTFDEQHDLLAGRGLCMPDRLRTMRWLKHISYYRLSAYFLPFKTGEQFAAGASFDQVAGLYIFDRKLRLVLLDAMAERISRETFVGHFRARYRDEPHLPLWMASELMSFGRLSRMFKACHPDIKKVFARRLDVADVTIVSSWLHTLNYVRNVCAHHSRLWNRELAVKPILPRRSPAWPYPLVGADRLYCVLVIIRHALLRAWPQCRWRERLFELIDRHPEVDLSAMQFPENWRNLPPWTDTGR